LPFVALAIYARDPRVFESPRLWAEEGSSYFASAVSHDAVSGLLNVKAAEHNPYLHPIPQLATWFAANFVALSRAPVVTTAAWCLIVLALLLVVLYGRAPLLDRWQSRLLVLAAPFLAVSNSENWANTLGAHFWVDYALVLLLLEGEVISGRRRLLGLVAFGLLALLSPTAWILLPAVVALCIVRWKQHRAYLGVLSAVVALDAAITLVVFPATSRHPASIAEAAHLVLSKLLLWPLAGFDVADRYTRRVLGLSESALRLSGWLLAAVLVALGSTLFYISRRDKTTIALLATHLAATLGFVALGLNVGHGLLPLLSGARYSWLPNALLIVLLAHQLDGALLRARKPSQLAFAAALLLCLIVAVHEYRYPDEPWLRGPDWRAEVERYELLPEYTTLKIWPKGWAVEVPRRRGGD
jgi:hypothetical protein